jgi:exopolyphosphatase/pppGpp-phosphohydrolase
MSESERLLIPSMHSKRVDVIVPGTFLLYQILTFFNKNEITCSEKDLLEGHFITTYL